MTEPTARITLRPAELVGLAGIVAVFVALITLMATRELIFSLIVLGGAFVLGLITLAMLMLAVTPNRPADGERQPDTLND
jgi:preprotein translocase subunit Sec61beta